MPRLSISHTRAFRPLIVMLIVVLIGAALIWSGPSVLAQDDAPTPASPTDAGYSADDPITANEQWTPVVEEVDGVEMVLVPTGCFQMGNDPVAPAAADDGGQQCFDAPFWIDRYEVTNQQFAAFLTEQGTTSSVEVLFMDLDDDDARVQQTVDGWRAIDAFAQHPVTDVNWIGGRDFCLWREGQLPTEAQWEYAARGPDGLLFPWGDTFVQTNVVGFISGTTEVGSKPDGVSWVGAFDLSGSVWEWSLSLFESYPYDSADGREDAEYSDVPRVLRGGSWSSSDRNHFRSANRLSLAPDGADGSVGFRCVRAYDPDPSVVPQEPVQSRDLDTETPAPETETPIPPTATTEPTATLVPTLPPTAISSATPIPTDPPTTVIEATPTPVPTLPPTATDVPTLVPTVPPPTATPTDVIPTITVNVESANLRIGPGVNYAVVGYAYGGETYPVVAQLADWYLVERGPDSTAWIWSGIVLLSPPDAQIDPAATVPAPPGSG